MGFFEVFYIPVCKSTNMAGSGKINAKKLLALGKTHMEHKRISKFFIFNFNPCLKSIAYLIHFV